MTTSAPSLPFFRPPAPLSPLPASNFRVLRKEFRVFSASLALR